MKTLMKILGRAIVSGLLLLPAMSGVQAAQDQSRDEIVLFDGSNLDQWLMDAKSNWRIVDGLLVSERGESNQLISKATFADFEMTLDFWVDEAANSGVFIRCENLEAITSRNCYEVNIYDKREDQTYRTGAIVNVAPPLVKVDTIGRWSTYQIRAQGKRLQLRINGVLTVDTEDSAHARGHITLQYDKGVTKFRNIKIKRL